MKSSKKRKIKYLFLARGPGETSQARALAKYISKKKGKIIFCLLQEKNLHFIKKDGEFKSFITKTPTEFKEIVEQERPDIILFFNSKTWAGRKIFSEKIKFKNCSPLTVGVDSNWLFNNKKYPFYKFIEWTDKILTLFPEKIFKLGLKKNKGGFLFPEKNQKKIISVGFIPSYKKPSGRKIKKIKKQYHLKKDEKLIFAYFSGFGAGHRIFAFENLIKSVGRLVKKGEKIKVLYLGSTDDLSPKLVAKNWLIVKEKLSSDEYFLTLASSDLVFQHQGMVTLAQAISAQIPVICNVHRFKNHPMPKIHFWEVEPFKKYGAAEMFTRSSAINKIAKTIEKLLYDKKIINKMKKKQKLITGNGEKKAYQIIKNLLKEKL